MFPIANESGQVIAFTARALDSPGDEKGRPQIPQLARNAALHQRPGPLQSRQGQSRHPQAMDFALLVEGQMDCISVYMRGIQNVIATSAAPPSPSSKSACCAARPPT
jgi:DNA primase